MNEAKIAHDLCYGFPWASELTEPKGDKRYEVNERLLKNWFEELLLVLRDNRPELIRRISDNDFS